MRDTVEWVENLEAGRVRVRPAHVLALADALDVDIVALLDRDAERAPSTPPAPRRPSGMH